MGQIGIRTVQDSAQSQEMKQALADQLREYNSIETEARTLAGHRGWKLEDLNPGIRTMSEILAHMKLMGGNRDSKIASMVIQGNTKGMIIGLKNAHRHKDQDGNVTALVNKLLEFENANIRQMESFL